MADKCNSCSSTDLRAHCELAGCIWKVCRQCLSFGIPGTDKWHESKQK